MIPSIQLSVNLKQLTYFQIDKIVLLFKCCKQLQQENPSLTISDLESLVSILSAIDLATSKLALMLGRTESHWAFRLSTSKSPSSVVFCFEKEYSFISFKIFTLLI